MSDSTEAESGRTALRVAAAVLLVVVVAPFVVTGVPAVIGAEESFVVLSGSMNAEPEPIIRPGDVVIVDGVDAATVEEGDIITFTNGGEEPITHRVVNVTEQDGQPAFRTKGDANEDADTRLVGPDQIVGEVIFVIPLIGHVVSFANTTQGFVLLVLLPVGLLVLSEVWNLVAPAGSDDGAEPTDPVESGRERPVGATPAAGTAHATGGSTDADGPEEASDGGPSTVTLGRAQAKWSTVGLVPVAAATGYVAFRLQSAWILTVFFASLGLCLLCGLIYLRIEWGSSAPESAGRAGAPAATVEGPRGGVTDEGGDEAAVTTVRPVVEGVRRDPVVTGRIERDLGDDSRVEVSVGSREALVEMALQRGTWVVRDAETGTYVLVDDGMVFRYDEDDPALDRATNRGMASGRSTVSGAEDGEREAREDGSDAADPDGEQRERERTTEDVVEPTGTGTDGSNDTDGRPGREPTSVDVGEIPSSGGNGDEPSSGSAWNDEDVTPAIGRADDEGPSGSASDSSAADGTEGTETERSVRADGGGTADLPGIVRGVGRLADLPIRVLEFVGYLAIEPPMALYRTLRPDERGKESESRPQPDRRSEREP